MNNINKLYENSLYMEDFNHDPYLLLKTATTYRYSTTFSFINESIADHGYQLALLAILYSVKYKKIYEIVDINELLKYAILHDISESVSSDVVSPVKYLNNNISNAFDEIESICIDALSEKRGKDFNYIVKKYSKFTGTNINEQFFKMLDLLAVLIKAHNELQLNNIHYKRVAKEIIPIIETKYIELRDAFIMYEQIHYEYIQKWYFNEVRNLIHKTQKLLEKYEEKENTDVQ